MPVFDPDNPKSHHEEAVRISKAVGVSPKHIIYRCKHCDQWHGLRPTGWKTQHICKFCGKLSYLYPWERDEAARLKGGDPYVPTKRAHGVQDQEADRGEGGPVEGTGDPRSSDP